MKIRDFFPGCCNISGGGGKPGRGFLSEWNFSMKG